jgi:hypothetical protein
MPVPDLTNPAGQTPQAWAGNLGSFWELNSHPFPVFPGGLGVQFFPVVVGKSGRKWGHFPTKKIMGVPPSLPCCKHHQ